MRYAAHLLPSCRDSDTKCKGDVAPSLLLKSVEAASGARYTAHKEQPRKSELITPVGTNYTPVGKVDLNELRRTALPATAAKPVCSGLFCQNE